MTGDKPLDWEAAYARMKRARDFVEAGAPRSADEVSRILRARAERVARPRPGPPRPTSPERHLLLFVHGGAGFAVDTADVLEVAPLRNLVPVPGTPVAILGVLLHRGRILPVVDLGPLFGHPARPGAAWVVGVEVRGGSFGVAADAVTGVARIAGDSLVAPPGRGEGYGGSLVRGLASDIAVLDLEAVAADHRVRVDDDSA